MIANNIKKQFVGIVGKDRYRDTPVELTSYAYDAFVEESLPDAVIFPMTTQEVSAVLKIASQHKIPVTGRGSGTNLTGSAIPVNHGIVLCLSKMDKILEVNTRDRYIIVQPGVINGDIQKALAPMGFFYPPDPASKSASTIGGNIATNAGGPSCLKYGVTKDYILGMEVVLASGDIIRFGSKNIKDVTGYNFTSLFCGSEGTLGIVTEAILKVVPKPEAAKTLQATFKDLDDTAKAVTAIIGSGIIPCAMELMDRKAANVIEDAVNLGLDREAEGTLLIEVDGVKEACEKEMEMIVAKLKQNNATHVEEAKSDMDRERLWGARRAAFAVFARLAPDNVGEDVTVPVSKVPEMIRKIVAITKKYELTAAIGAHAGDGNMHPLIVANKDDREEWQRVEKAFDEIFEAAVSLGGTLSGEHGIGLGKKKYLPLVMDTATIAFMKRIKKAIDPDAILNQGKFV
jgi:glycolate oxidase